MKFERKHQLIKKFTANCNFHNVAKSICQKYKAKIQMENMRYGPYLEHPLITSEFTKCVKNGHIKYVVIKGIMIKNNKEVFLPTFSKEIYRICDMQIVSEKLNFTCKKVNISHFDQRLLAFEILDEEDTQTIIDSRDFLFEVGLRFWYIDKYFVYFSHLIN